ncbi:hypothetical protein QBC38DRAFT_550644 [Podospora fimiseda]|uniref:Uncharacterized protein n=1 Tax=Podospora fimiseda TaxID=252190 RepID=A0AAN6YLB1_9PEZI|nr:hypothetical protein QBC38DRAFT_550644 [Podospora fimiseda]
MNRESRFEKVSTTNNQDDRGSSEPLASALQKEDDVPAESVDEEEAYTSERDRHSSRVTLSGSSPSTLNQKAMQIGGRLKLEETLQGIQLSDSGSSSARRDARQSAGIIETSHTVPNRISSSIRQDQPNNIIGQDHPMSSIPGGSWRGGRTRRRRSHGRASVYKYIVWLCHICGQDNNWDLFILCVNHQCQHRRCEFCEIEHHSIDDWIDS